jgi:hypothetical protein
VLAAHEAGLVAPLRGIDALAADERYRVGFDAAGPPPLRRWRGCGGRARRRRATRGVRSRSSAARARPSTRPPATGRRDRSTSCTRRSADADVVRPVLVSGWQTWEHVVGHHDELTDVASLGLLLARWPAASTSPTRPTPNASPRTARTCSRSSRGCIR